MASFREMNCTNGANGSRQQQQPTRKSNQNIQVYVRVRWVLLSSVVAVAFLILRYVSAGLSTPASAVYALRRWWKCCRPRKYLLDTCSTRNWQRNSHLTAPSDRNHASVMSTPPLWHHLSRRCSAATIVPCLPTARRAQAKHTLWLATSVSSWSPPGKM